MIKVTSLQNEEFFLNADLIERIENVPDTLITLVNGKKMRVKEDSHIVVERFIHYKRRIHSLAEVSDEQV